MSKIKMSDEDLQLFGIKTQADLERFQKKINEQMGTAVEYEPLLLPDEVSPDMIAYLKSKGMTAGTEITEQPQPPKSVIDPQDIQQFINSKK